MLRGLTYVNLSFNVQKTKFVSPPKRALHSKMEICNRMDIYTLTTNMLRYGNLCNSQGSNKVENRGCTAFDTRRVLYGPHLHCDSMEADDLSLSHLVIFMPVGTFNMVKRKSRRGIFLTDELSIFAWRSQFVNANLSLNYATSIYTR